MSDIRHRRNKMPEMPHAKQWAKLAGVSEGTLRDNIKRLMKMLDSL